MPLIAARIEELRVALLVSEKSTRELRAELRANEQALKTLDPNSISARTVTSVVVLDSIKQCLQSVGDGSVSKSALESQVRAHLKGQYKLTGFSLRFSQCLSSEELLVERGRVRLASAPTPADESKES